MSRCIDLDVSAGLRFKRLGVLVRDQSGIDRSLTVHQLSLAAGDHVLATTLRLLLLLPNATVFFSCIASFIVASLFAIRRFLEAIVDKSTKQSRLSDSEFSGQNHFAANCRRTRHHERSKRRRPTSSCIVAKRCTKRHSTPSSSKWRYVGSVVIQRRTT